MCAHVCESVHGCVGRVYDSVLIQRSDGLKEVTVSHPGSEGP